MRIWIKLPAATRPAILNFGMVLFLIVAGCTDKQSLGGLKISVCPSTALHSFSEHIPERQPDALTGSAFMELTRDMTYDERQQAATRELLAGNVPDRLREPAILSFFSDGGDTSSHHGHV